MDNITASAFVVLGCTVAWCLGILYCDVIDRARGGTPTPIRFLDEADEEDFRQRTDPMRAVQIHCPLCAQLDEEMDDSLSVADRRGDAVLCAHHARVQALLDLELDMLGDLDDDDYHQEIAS